MELTLAVRRQVTAGQAAKWSKATRAEKTAILDAVVATTGWHRDHARKAIRDAVARNGAAPAGRAGTSGGRTYGDGGGRRAAVVLGVPGRAEQQTAARRAAGVAAAAGACTANCTWTTRSPRQLLAMAPATIDRRLAADRAELQPRAARRPNRGRC